MSSNSKICPECQLMNAAMNLCCLQCQASLVHVNFAPNWTDKYAGESPDRNYFLEEMLNPTMLVCLPLAVLCIVLAIMTLPSVLTPMFFMLGVILAGIPFFPGDPVGDWFRLRIEQLNKPKEKEPG
ncbi:MAG: hypothetical protein ACAI44_30560 [Candidatus Sericytochromatia bacterium]